MEGSVRQGFAIQGNYDVSSLRSQDNDTRTILQTHSYSIEKYIKRQNQNKSIEYSVSSSTEAGQPIVVRRTRTAGQLKSLSLKVVPRDQTFYESKNLSLTLRYAGL